MSVVSINFRGSEILRLLDILAPEPLSEDVRDLYDAAYENVSTNLIKAIELGKRALLTLDRLSSIPLGDSNALAYAKGRCHLLIASTYLNQEVDLESAEEHYLYSRDQFHSRQWSHLESLAFLGLAIARRKREQFEEALVACKSAQDSVEHESIPDRIDTIYLRKAIEKERLELQELLSHALLTRIPIVSDIAAGLGRIAEENIDEYLSLEDKERKGADFGVRVVGDSMAEHNILSGDIALIRQQPTVEIGEIAAVVITTSELEALGVLKRYYVYEERGDMRHWFLKSSSPISDHLVVIPRGANVKAIKALYTKASQTRRIRNPVKYYEDSGIGIAGKYVGVLRKSFKA
jgi:SOS-response transcriptional repressor LexA